MKNKWMICVLAMCVMGSSMAAFADETTEETAVEETAAEESASEETTTEEEEREETTAAEETGDENVKVVGTESKDGYCVRLNNATKREIVGIAIREIDTEEFSENMLGEETFAVEEEVLLYFNPEKTEEDSVEETEENKENQEEEFLLSTGYDVQIAFTEDEKYVLHAFPFEDMEEATIYAIDGVAYIEYTSISSHETVSTKEAEFAIAENERAAVQAESPQETYTESYDYVDYSYAYDNSYTDYDYGYSNYGGGYSNYGEGYSSAAGCLGDSALVY